MNYAKFYHRLPHALLVSTQGSAISPMLFNVHIDDLEDTIPNLLNVSTSKYEDDCTLDQVVEIGDSSHIQEAVDAVLILAELNKMVINVKKTCGSVLLTPY